MADMYGEDNVWNQIMQQKLMQEAGDRAFQEKYAQEEAARNYEDPEQRFLNNQKIAASQQAGAPISLYGGQTDAGANTQDWLQKIMSAQQPNQAQPAQMEMPTQGSAPQSSSYEKAVANYLKGMQEAQGLQKEGIGDIQKRLLGLQNEPAPQDSLQKAVLAAADLWGGGNGRFKQMYDEANPHLTKAQKQTAITQLEDTLRKARGDLSDSQLGILKAQMGFEEAKMKANQKGAGERITASQASDLGDLSVLKDQARNIGDEWMKIFGKRDQGLAARLGSAAASYNPESPENIFDAQRKEWAQQIGGPLEGGKLSDSDFERYLNNFVPSGFDSKDRAKAKIAAFEKYADSKKTQKIKALKNAGFNLSGFDQPAAQRNIDPALAAEIKRRGLH